MTRILCLDPGVSTGWAVFRLDAVTPLRLEDSGIIPNGLDGFVHWAYHHPAMVEEFDTVVAELFILDGRTAQPDLTPLRIETAIMMIYGKWGDGLPIAWQRNFMKTHAPDALLKEKGLWKPGPGHDRDAIRHGLAWAKTSRHAPTLRWLYGDKGDA